MDRSTGGDILVWLRLGKKLRFGMHILLSVKMRSSFLDVSSLMSSISQQVDGLDRCFQAKHGTQCWLSPASHQQSSAEFFLWETILLGPVDLLWLVTNTREDGDRGLSYYTSLLFSKLSVAAQKTELHLGQDVM